MRADNVLVAASGILSTRNKYPYPKLTNWDIKKATLFRIFMNYNITKLLNVRQIPQCVNETLRFLGSICSTEMKDMGRIAPFTIKSNETKE